MRKSLLILALVALVLNAQAVIKVAYVTNSYGSTTAPVKTMAATATTIDNDPIIQMLKNDANLEVTVKNLTSVTVTDVISDLASYDVIIVQESFGSAAGILTPSGALSLKNMPKPFIYNKTFALRNGKAITNNTAAAAAESASLTLTVESGALTNDLFKACTIGTSNEIAMFNAVMMDDGTPTNKDVTKLKSLNYTTGNVLSNTSTILARPTGNTTAIICVNDIPAGTTIDSETLTSRMITFGMNFGAICGNAGKNITDDNLTMWRNAVYILAGQAVPATKPKITTGFNQPNASTISFDGKVVRNINSEVLNVFNVTGKLISTSNKDIDMSNLAKGVYFVKGQNNTLKVSVQ